MEKQVSFCEMEYLNKRKKTQKEKFLEKMQAIVPLEKWCAIVRPFYYENGNGRQPTPLAVMLRMYLISLWYNLSDEMTEDLIIENMAVKGYVAMDGEAPDSTTLCKFRHILESNNLTKTIFDELRKTLEERKILLKQGTIVDATIIEAPNSVKNKDKKPTPEMSHTFKKRPFYGMKAHIGVDQDSGLVHSVATSTAKESDIGNAVKVLHGEEEYVRGDAGFVGLEKREEICELYKDGSGEVETHSKSGKKIETLKKRADVKFVINKKRGQIKTEEDKEAEREKSKVRWKVENPFLIVKHHFGFRKTRYRTIAKTECKLLMLFALANLFCCAQKKLLTK
jgi:IS5 family transposase